jgi:MFS family permease
MSGSGGRAALAIAAGVAVAAALGKVAPVAGELRAAFGLSAFALGTVISLITLLTALVAAPAAGRLGGRDVRRLLAGGLLLVALAGGAMALVSRAAVLIALRVGEGVGFLLVMLTGPVVLLAQVAEARRSFVLALWGACIPAGLAISAVAGGLFDGESGWRSWFGALAVVCLALAVAVAVFVRPARSVSPRRPRLAMALRGGLLPLAAGFAAVAVIGVSVVSLLPTYLRTEEQLAAGAAGGLTSVVAAASILGSVCAGWLLHRGISPVALAAAALLCPVFTAVTFLPQVSLPARIAAAVLLMFAGGVAVAAGYGALPHVAPDTDRLALGNGLLIQFGSIGTLLGPPVFAAATGLRHWSVGIWLVAATSLVGVLLIHRATRPAHLGEDTTALGATSD